MKKTRPSIVRKQAAVRYGEALEMLRLMWTDAASPEDLIEIKTVDFSSTFHITHSFLCVCAGMGLIHVERLPGKGKRYGFKALPDLQTATGNDVLIGKRKHKPGSSRRYNGRESLEIVGPEPEKIIRPVQVNFDRPLPVFDETDQQERVATGQLNIPPLSDWELVTKEEMELGVKLQSKIDQPLYLMGLVKDGVLSVDTLQQYSEVDHALPGMGSLKPESGQKVAIVQVLYVYESVSKFQPATL